jgi:hypothetical protein
MLKKLNGSVYMPFTDKQFYAAAKWWADRFPGRSGKRTQETSSVGDARQEAEALAESIAQQFLPNSLPPKNTVTPAQYQIFVETLAERLKFSMPQGTVDGRAFHAIETDYGPMTGALVFACQLAKINGDSLPFKTSLYLQDDGQIMVPDGYTAARPLVYDGQPNIAYADAKQADFSASSYYMAEKRYFLVELAEGQEYTQAIKRRTGTEYETRVAKAGEVLAARLTPAAAGNPPSAEDIISAKDHPGVDYIHAWDKADAADGAKEKYGSGRVEKLDENHVRVLSLPFRVKEVTATAGTGFGGNYQILQPGDRITETVHTGYTAIDIIRKADLDSGKVSWVPSTKDGKVVQPAAPAPKVLKP